MQWQLSPNSNGVGKSGLWGGCDRKGVSRIVMAICMPHSSVTRISPHGRDYIHVDEFEGGARNARFVFDEFLAEPDVASKD